jgi:hypothetical protein
VKPVTIGSAVLLAIHRQKVIATLCAEINNLDRDRNVDGELALLIT